ncbi:MAG: lipoyl(octanoyl) transferase LipB [Hyphomicrobium sp.]
MIDWAISDVPIAYPSALAAMDRRAARIRDKGARELVWLLEHPALYTAGTSARPADLIDPMLLPTFQTGRGGQYTFHGPGQRIAYLMLDLKARGGDVRRFVSQLEAWIVGTLLDFNVKGESRPGRVGVWVQRPETHGGGEAKVAAIGLRVCRGVTTHGVSLNVDPDLRLYRGIVPCGIADYGITSLTDLGLPVTMTDADVALRRNFEANFGTTRSVAAPESSALPI